MSRPMTSYVRLVVMVSLVPSGFGMVWVHVSDFSLLPSAVLYWYANWDVLLRVSAVTV